MLKNIAKTLGDQRYVTPPVSKMGRGLVTCTSPGDLTP